MAKISDKPHSGDWEFTGEPIEEYLERTRNQLSQLQKESRQVDIDAGDVVGLILRYPVADGYAWYVVVKDRPLTLQHIPYCDGYRIPDAYIRGLRKQDIIADALRERGIAKLFAAKRRHCESTTQ